MTDILVNPLFECVECGDFGNDATGFYKKSLCKVCAEDQYTRITKQQLISSIKKYKSINLVVCPSKCSPISEYAIQHRFTAYDLIATYKGQVYFDIAINSFIKHNCNEKLGKRIYFYIKDAGQNKTKNIETA